VAAACGDDELKRGQLLPGRDLLDAACISRDVRTRSSRRMKHPATGESWRWLTTSGTPQCAVSTACA
jgi:hypothetical protein